MELILMDKIFATALFLGFLSVAANKLYFDPKSEITQYLAALYVFSLLVSIVIVFCKIWI